VEKPIRILVLNGSIRAGNYTAMASALVVDELRRHPKVHVEVITIGELKLDPPGINPNSTDAKRLQDAVKGATAVVIVTPEYHGSFSSLVKLAIENLGFPSVLAGKPIALLGVAAGTIGAIKSLEHLRGVLSHVGAMVLPLLTSVPNVQSVFDKEGHCLDPKVEKMVRGVATQLMQYIENAVCPRVTLEALLRGEPVGAAH
jgi:chromate reductase